VIDYVKGSGQIEQRQQRKVTAHANNYNLSALAAVIPRYGAIEIVVRRTIISINMCGKGLG